MSRKPTDAPSFAGRPKFADDDDDAAPLVAPPSREVREQAQAAAKAIGFVPDKPAKATTPTPPAETAPAAPAAPARERPTARKRERRVALYPAHYSLRMTDEDRDRFDDYAARHHIAKGEAMRRLLDLAEAEERNQNGEDQ